jgi:hypothetical protein
MTKPVYISRNFVEFGPFKAEELVDFHSRGILGELDHVREDGHDDWLFIGEWIAKAGKGTASAAAAPAAKKAAAKKAPAKKAAAKKAAK